VSASTATNYLDSLSSGKTKKGKTLTPAVRASMVASLVQYSSTLGPRFRKELHVKLKDAGIVVDAVAAGVDTVVSTINTRADKTDTALTEIRDEVKDMKAALTSAIETVQKEFHNMRIGHVDDLGRVPIQQLLNARRNCKGIQDAEIRTLKAALQISKDQRVPEPEAVQLAEEAAREVEITKQAEKAAKDVKKATAAAAKAAAKAKAKAQKDKEKQEKGGKAKAKAKAKAEAKATATPKLASKIPANFFRAGAAEQDDVEDSAGAGGGSSSDAGAEQANQ
jgi:hypothetical protein